MCTIITVIRFVCERVIHVRHRDGNLNVTIFVPRERSVKKRFGRCIIPTGSTAYRFRSFGLSY
jgi:hypothetical protein